MIALHPSSHPASQDKSVKVTAEYSTEVAQEMQKGSSQYSVHSSQFRRASCARSRVDCYFF